MKKHFFKYETFDELASYLNSIPYINHGGCGISAWFIYRFFKANGEKPKIVYAYRSYDPCYVENQCALKGQNPPVAPGHAFVKVGDQYYDSRGTYSCPGNFDRWHTVPEKFLLKSLSSDNWNDAFSRDVVPEMEKKIGINLPTL